MGNPAGIWAQRVNGNGHAPPTHIREAPSAFFLAQNFPNPFNPSTKIAFGIKDPVHVALNIYDVTGRLVRVLVDDRLEAGYYEETWDGRDDSGHPVSSGVYFCKLKAGLFKKNMKIVLLR